MVVVDSSALIPLARVGELGLVMDTFDTVRTIAPVEEEVLEEGKPGTAHLSSFLEEVAVEELPDKAEVVAELEGIAVAGAGVVLLAEDRSEGLVANEKALMEVARAHGVESWWVTTLLLHCTKSGIVSSGEASEILYGLVDERMNLSPSVYTQVQNKLDKIGG